MELRLARTAILTLSLFAIAAAPAATQADEAREAIEAVQGQWVRRQPSRLGLLTFIKEHRGATTIVTAYDEQQTVVYAHTSEFRLERFGPVRVFTYYDRTVTVGPGVGQTSKEPVSFAYRVADGQFIEVYGVLDGDSTPPNMIVWTRWAPAAEAPSTKEPAAKEPSTKEPSTKEPATKDMSTPRSADASGDQSSP